MRKGQARKTAPKKATARRVASVASARTKAAPPAKPRPARTGGRSRTKRPEPSSAPTPPVGTDEERIESAKYQVTGPRRAFDEERFLFPESYGVNRIRLLVKDAEWLFAYWDVNPASIDGLRSEIGERALAVSKLTLRVTDAANEGVSLVLLPAGARSWYVRVDSARRAYRAELGLTLPSGVFRRLATSNTVVTPRVGPSPDRASRVLLYGRLEALPREGARSVEEREIRSAVGSGPWKASRREIPLETGERDQGGASDVFRPGGASDVFPPGGASDVHRR